MTSFLDNSMKVVGWVGTLGAGALAAKGMSEFLPASREIVYAVSGGLEVMNIVSLAWISGGRPGNKALKTVMGLGCAAVVALDIAGVAGQLSHGYQSDINSQNAVVEVATAKQQSEVAAARRAVENIDRQFAAIDKMDEQSAFGLAKAKGDRDQIRAANKLHETAKTERADLNTRRDVAVTKLAEAEAKAGEVRGDAVNASSEQAAAQFVAAFLGVSQDKVAYGFILLFAALLPLFSVGMMLAGGHKKPVDAPVAPEATPVATVATVAPVTIQKPVNKRSEAAKKGWETRRKKEAEKRKVARKVQRVAETDTKVVALTA
jgi:hypothetical protein